MGGFIVVICISLFLIPGFVTGLKEGIRSTKEKPTFSNRIVLALLIFTAFICIIGLPLIVLLLNS